MTISSLDISQSEAREMLEYFSNRKQTIIDANHHIFSKLKEIDGMIEKLNAVITSKGLKYPKDGSWNQKIKYILGLNPNGLSTKDIVRSICEYQGVSKEEMFEEYKNIYRSVAPTLSAGVSNNLYSRIEDKEGSIYKIID